MKLSAFAFAFVITHLVAPAYAEDASYLEDVSDLSEVVESTPEESNVNAKGFKLPFGIRIKHPNNTHLMDANSDTGFAIYRTSKPNKVSDFKKLCKAGVTEIMVLDGSGSREAFLAKKYCPALKVIYNKVQSAKTPLSSKFLQQFDTWVQYAKDNGVKIAFRCSCGCHRTGRLAAYYNMKYKGFTAAQAINDMYDKGRFMFLYGFLKGQVRAMRNYIDGNGCRQKRKYCVKISRVPGPETAPESKPDPADLPSDPV